MNKKCYCTCHLNLETHDLYIKKMEKKIDELENLIEKMKISYSYNHMNLVNACKRIEYIEDFLVL